MSQKITRYVTVKDTSLKVCFSVYDEQVHIAAIWLGSRKCAHLLDPRIVKDIQAKLMHEHTMNAA